jgi:spectinomycin phosphotransferase
MFIGAGVGNVWNNSKEVELFYAGYGKTQINQTIIDYYRCDRIIQDIVEYHQQLLADNTDYNDKLTSYNHFIAMFAPNGVVDIALKRINRFYLTTRLDSHEHFLSASTPKAAAPIPVRPIA